jgi:hypothetical protein
MNTDELLAICADRGLKVAVNEAGVLVLRGKRTESTERLLRVLRLPVHRDEILRRFRLKPTRRVVLLKEGRDGPIESVLFEGTADWQPGGLRKLAAQFPGRTVAAEWLSNPGSHAEPRWTRFVWLTWQGGSSGQVA